MVGAERVGRYRAPSSARFDRVRISRRAGGSLLVTAARRSRQRRYSAAHSPTGARCDCHEDSSFTSPLRFRLCRRPAARGLRGPGKQAAGTGRRGDPGAVVCPAGRRASTGARPAGGVRRRHRARRRATAARRANGGRQRPTRADHRPAHRFEHRPADREHRADGRADDRADQDARAAVERQAALARQPVEPAAALDRYADGGQHQEA